MLDCADTPSAIAQREGLIQVRDTGQMQAWVDQAFAANEPSGRLANPEETGPRPHRQVMKISGGKADPKMVGS
jgi:Asp-tRNA(Asn)/Glu-tRNA(Gln) amidotransferase B subunit